MRGWQHDGGLLRTPDGGEDGPPGVVPEPAWGWSHGPGPFTTYWWAGPDAVHLFTWRRDEQARGAWLLTRQDGWVLVPEMVRWPCPTEVLTSVEAERRLGIPPLEDDAHVTSASYDACWRCGYDGRMAHHDRLTGREVPCPGWTDYGVWARSHHPGALSSGA